MKETLQKLRSENPTWGYKKLAIAAGCSKSLAKYHLRPEAKEHHRTRMKFQRRKSALAWKRELFCKRLRTSTTTILLEDMESKFRPNPICYLSGRPLDLDSRSGFSLDHIIPASRGGLSSLDNMGLAHPTVNMCKSELTPEEFFALCKEVLEFQGYKVTK